MNGRRLSRGEQGRGGGRAKHRDASGMWAVMCTLFRSFRVGTEPCQARACGPRYRTEGGGQGVGSAGVALRMQFRAIPLPECRLKPACGRFAEANRACCPMNTMVCVYQCAKTGASTRPRKMRAFYAGGIRMAPQGVCGGYGAWWYRPRSG